MKEKGNINIVFYFTAFKLNFSSLTLSYSLKQRIQLSKAQKYMSLKKYNMYLIYMYLIYNYTTLTCNGY